MAFVPDATAVTPKSRFVPDTAAQPPADPAARAKAEAELHAAEAAPTPTAFGVPAGGALDAVRTGVRQGARGITAAARGVLGLPQLLESAITAPANYFGANVQGPVAQTREFLSPAELRPQNRTEEIADTGTEAVGGLLGGGALGEALQVGKLYGAANNVGKVLTSNYGAQLGGALAGAGAAEATKSAGGGEVAQTLASLAGSFAPGVAAARAPKNYVENAPIPLTSEQHIGNAKSLYNQADASDLTYKGDALENFKAALAGDKELGNDLLPKLGPETAQALDTLRDFHGDTPLSRMKDFKEILNKHINAAVRTDPGGGDVRLGQKLKGRVKDFINNSAPEDTTGDSSALAKLRKADKYYTQGKKTAEIDKLVSDTEMSAQGDKGAALRTKFAALAKNEKDLKGFTADERTAVTDAGKTGLLDRIISGAGKLAPDSAVARTLMAGSGVGAIPLALGTGAKALSRSRALGKAKTVTDLTRRAPAPEAKRAQPQLGLDEVGFTPSRGVAAPFVRPAQLPNDSLGLSLVPDELATELRTAKGAPQRLDDAQRAALAEQLAGELQLAPTPQRQLADDLAGDLSAEQPLTVEGGLSGERQPFDYAGDRLPAAGSGAPVTPVGRSVGLSDRAQLSPEQHGGVPFNLDELPADPASSANLGDEFAPAKPAAPQRGLQLDARKGPAGEPKVVHDHGMVELQFPYGKISLEPLDGGRFRIRHSKADHKVRGTGYGQDMYRAAVDYAESQGGLLESDSLLSADAVKVYDRLQKQGYRVTAGAEDTAHVPTPGIAKASADHKDPLFILESPSRAAYDAPSIMGERLKALQAKQKK